MIRNNKNIKGINLAGKEYKMSQYADDTTVALGGSEISLRTTLNIVDQFAKYSGLKPNIEKTKAVWIGSKRHCQDLP